MPRERVAVVGLGKLGLCLATILASKGYEVTGIDTDEHKLELISQGKPPNFEPRLERLLRKNRDRLSVSMNYEDIKRCSISFVVVPTPSETSGEFSLFFVKQAMEKVGSIISKVRKYHLVVLTSTVMPGSMQNTVKPTLETSSGKKCGADFGLCYNPEFVALGDVVRGMVEPDFILLGESDKRAGDILSKLQRKLCNNSPYIERMDFANAELAKISVNSFVTMKMSYANTLAEICEKMEGGDVTKVTKAIGRDSRIGPAYLKGALGYGGPCFPRDNIAFATFAKRIGAQGDLAITTHEVNMRQIDRITQRIESEGVAPPFKISVLGLSYKPNTNVVESSQASMLAVSLARKGFEVHVFDPAITTVSSGVIVPALVYESHLLNCIRNTELCIIATPWKRFSKINKAEFKNKIVFDCWGIFDGLPKAKKYLRIGLYAPSA